MKWTRTPTRSPSRLARHAGILWLALVAVMYGGVALLRMLVQGDVLTDWQVEQFRAGHAHAGVLLLLMLVYALFLERTTWSAVRRHLTLGVLGLGVICQSGGFFLHMVVGAPATFSAGRLLTLAGAVLLAAAVIALGITLIRKNDDDQEEE